MLQRAHPPAQFFEIHFAMLVREGVDDVFNFRGASPQRIKEHEPRRQDRRPDSVVRDSCRQASISSRNWLTVTTSVRCRKLPSFAASIGDRIDRVGESFDDSLVKQLRVGQFDARLFHRDQMSGKIAAVDGRDVLRQQRLEAFWCRTS